jgi:hypothetical protein
MAQSDCEFGADINIQALEQGGKRGLVKALLSVGS